VLRAAFAACDGTICVPRCRPQNFTLSENHQLIIGMTDVLNESLKP